MDAYTYDLLTFYAVCGVWTMMAAGYFGEAHTSMWAFRLEFSTALRSTVYVLIGAIWPLWLLYVLVSVTVRIVAAMIGRSR